MELNEAQTNYCSYCLKITDEKLSTMRFTHLFVPPITFQFCPACFMRLLKRDQEVISEMRDRHMRIRNPDAFRNFGAGNNGVNNPS